jgi:hypothetical protein
MVMHAAKIHAPSVPPPERAAVAVVGAGAAGLMAAVFAGRAAREPGAPPGVRVAAFDGAKSLGAKVLVAGGGRCNVTHHAVTPADYFGSASANSVKQVLRRFGVADTVDFFSRLGVDLKREETGKLFPTTDNARTVLNALLRAVSDADATIHHPARITAVERVEDSPGGGFVVRGPWGACHAERLVLATGGLALPKTGSDGLGYSFATALGHTLTDPIFPALVPLVVRDGHFVRTLSGIAAPARVEVRLSTGKRVYATTAPVLLTHFGLSGPAILDASRHLASAKRDDAGAVLVLNFMAQTTPEAVDASLAGLGKRSVGRWARESLPERLADALCDAAGVDPACPGSELRRDPRRALVAAMTELAVPVDGDRGYTFAEVTAGGVPLSEVNIRTMESRVCPGLYLCGEILDVEGRIGGFNFQWAWATGFIAGSAAGQTAGQTECQTERPTGGQAEFQTGGQTGGVAHAPDALTPPERPRSVSADARLS